MSSNKMPGNLMGLQLNGNFISCEMSCEFNYDSDLRAASPVDAGGWKEWISGTKGWNINLNAGMLLRQSGTSVKEVLNAFLLGENIGVKFMVKKPSMPQFTISGNVKVQSGSISAGFNTRATWNTTLTGNGKFTVEVSTPTIYNMIYYEATSFKIITASQVQALFNRELTLDPITLNTGTNRFFTIAVPSDYKLLSAYNETAEEDILSEYIVSNITIEGVLFKLYRMETAVPYSANNIHILILTND